MCWCGHSSSRVLPNRELDKYRQWRRWAYSVTALIAVFCLTTMQIHHLNNHWHERYEKYLEDGRKNQSIGADLVSGSCGNKPLDHKTELIDCVRARAMSAINPERLAYNMAFEHLYEDHLSLLSFIGGCHDGFCNSLLWRFADKFLHHYQFTVTVAMFVFGGMAVLAVWIYIRCYLGYLEKRRVEKMAHGNPVLQNARVLFDKLEDTAKVKRALQAGNFVEAGTEVAAIQQAYNQLSASRKAVASHEVALLPEVGPDHDQFLHLRTPYTLFDTPTAAAVDRYKQRV